MELLKDRVVVISGVGPALGTTLAKRCAEAGADLVLAARTVERLEDADFYIGTGEYKRAYGFLGDSYRQAVFGLR